MAPQVRTRDTAFERGWGSGSGGRGPGPGTHLAGARTAPRAAAASGVGAQAGGGGEQAVVEGENFATDEALQAAAQQQQAVARLHPVLVLGAVEAHSQLRKNHVPRGPGAKGGADGSAQAQSPGPCRKQHSAARPRTATD